MPLPLRLASTSRYRRALLERLGVPFQCQNPDVDESVLKTALAGESPRSLAEALALAKASNVARQWPDAAVIGGDQVVAVGDQILGKPGTVERAERQLALMVERGEVVLFSALALVAPDREPIRIMAEARLYPRRLTPEAIRRYVAADQPLDCAGSFKLEERGIALFERVEADDHSAITGVPLIALTSALLDLGFEIP